MTDKELLQAIGQMDSDLLLEANEVRENKNLQNRSKKPYKLLFEEFLQKISKIKHLCR